MASSTRTNSQFTNHESLPSLHESFSNFTRAFPQYHQTVEADRIREREYYHLSMSNRVCFDYIGHGLFSYSQQQSHSDRAAATASTSSSPPPRLHSTSLEPPFFDISYNSVSLNFQIQHVGQESELECTFRRRIMAFMNISEDDYTLVFTANQSSAFKLLADSYPFESNKNLLTVYDYENEAVEAMIDSSKRKGARVMSAEFSWPTLRIHSGKLRRKLVSKRKKRKRGLFVFPLQSRMTGARYLYLWMSIAQENGWHVLLDACALGPKYMETLGLSLFKPDYLICSFFKVFGENPSGFACLLVKKSSASILKDSKTEKKIGIVRLVPARRPCQLAEESASATSHTKPEQEAKLQLSKHDTPEASFSGTITTQEKSEENSEQNEIKETNASQKAPEIEESVVTPSSISGNSQIECRGLDHADSVGLILLSARARFLINWLVNALMCLRHPRAENELPPVRIYGPKIKFDRAPALAFNVYDWNGEKIDPALVQKLADRNNLSLSRGVLNHIWFSDKNEGERETRASEEGTTVLNGKTGKLHSRISVVTASIGLLTNFEDVYRLWSFVSKFLDADFVEKERWRYTALNRKMIEV